jgi:hypothetical protein
VPVGAHPVQHLAEGAQGHRLLAERGQHPSDVADEHRGRADQQDAAALEAPAVAVEQVRHPVQGYRRLPGARTAADQRRAGRRRADRLVLLALDRGDDVAHGPAGAAGQRGQQRAVADHPHALGDRAGREQVVLDPHHPRASGADDPAPHDVHPHLGGRLVERRRRRCAPVHHERLELFVPQAEAADVADLPVVEVQPAEDQAVVLGVERTHPPGRLVDQHVALVQSTHVAELGPAVPVRGDGGGVRPDRLQPRVHAIHVVLLQGNLGQGHGRRTGQPGAPAVVAGRATATVAGPTG